MRILPLTRAHDLCPLIDSYVTPGSSSHSHSGTYCIQYSTTGAAVVLGTHTNTLGLCWSTSGSDELDLLGMQLVWLSVANCHHTIYESLLLQCRSRANHNATGI